MANELKKKKLGELLSIKHGFPFSGEFFASSGEYIVLTPGNFHENGGFKRIKGKEKFYISEFPKDYLCKEGDLIVAMTEQAVGLLGSTAIVPESGIYLHNQRIGLISCNQNLIDKLFLYYLFMTDSVRKQIRDSSSGTKVKHTSPQKVYDVEVFIPDLEIQKKNAQLLWSIEQKVNNNNLVVSCLESMTKTLYDHWFVQFDFPNIEGNPYRASGGEMVWNQEMNRNIPKEWNVGTLYDIAHYVNGLACQKHRPKDNNHFLPVVKIREMQDGISFSTETVSANIPDKHQIADGDILFSWSATLKVMFWVGGHAGLNQHIFKVLPKSDSWKEFVFHQLSAYVEFFKKMADARKTTMGHITSDHMEQSRIVLPPQEIIDNFSCVVKPMHKKIVQAQQDNNELSRLRDWLLPMLMNGQVTVQ